MSTKTSFKRIALVAASALAIAGFSAVPANAAVAPSFTSGTMTITGTTTATASAVTGTYNSFVIDFTSETAYTANVTSTGVGTLAVPNIVPTSSDQISTITNSPTSSILYGTTDTTDVPGIGIALGSNNITIAAYSAVGGTQTITVGTSTFTITWAAAAAASPAASTVYFVETQTGTATTVKRSAPTADSTAAVLSTAGTQRGLLLVRVNDDQSPAAGVNGEITAVTVSGPGLVSSTVNATTGSQSATANTATVDSALGYVAYTVLGSGVSGAATYTVTHTTALGVTTVLATKVINFYGTSPAKISAVQNNFVAGVSGKLGGTPSAATGSGAFTVTAVDSNGNKVGGIDTTVRAGSATAAGWWIVSSNTACISSTIGYNLAAGTGATDVNNAVGVYEMSITGGTAGATSGCSSDVEIKYTTSTLTVMSAGKFKVTVGGTEIATLSLTPNAASVKPGEKVTLTLAAKDSKGNKVADGDYAIFDTTDAAAWTGLTSSASLTASPFAKAATDESDITIVDGVAEATFYAPYFTGDVLLSTTLATSASLATALDASTLSTTVSVDASDAGAALALDAANAATDAANNAYDEAQNATQAASDALAAVTALAAQVKSLIASVKKLTAAVAKLKK